MKHSPEAIQNQCEKTAAARSAASVQPEAAYDYIEVGKIKFYRPTMPHVWLLLKVAQKNGSILPDDRQTVMAYILANSAESVRDKCVMQATRGQLADAAYLFMMDNNLDPEAVFPIVNELAADVFEKKTTKTGTENQQEAQAEA